MDGSGIWYLELKHLSYVVVSSDRYFLPLRILWKQTEPITRLLLSVLSANPTDWLIAPLIQRDINNVIAEFK